MGLEEQSIFCGKSGIATHLQRAHIFCDPSAEK